jgi:hypothetical protein
MKTPNSLRILKISAAKEEDKESRTQQKQGSKNIPFFSTFIKQPWTKLLNSVQEGYTPSPLARYEK